MGLRDADGRIREHAVLLSEKLLAAGNLPDTVWSQLRLLAADPSVRVRYQLAFTVGEIHRPDSAQVLAALLLRDPTNLWIQAAVFSSLAEGAGSLFIMLASDARIRGDRVGQEWLRRLGGYDWSPGPGRGTLSSLPFCGPAPVRTPAGIRIALCLGRWAASHRQFVGPGGPGWAGAALLRPGPKRPRELRRSRSPCGSEAMQLLSVGPYNFASTGDLLLLQLGSGPSETVQSAALAALGRFDDPRIAPALIQRWRILTPRLRRDALTALLARTDRVAAVLAALESGRGRADLSFAPGGFPAHGSRPCDPPARPATLRPSAPATARGLAALQAGAGSEGRAGPWPGDLYRALCRLPSAERRDSGPWVPTWPASESTARERVLSAILEPNAEVRRDYLTYVVETAAGRAAYRPPAR